MYIYIYLVTYIRRGAAVGPSVERRGARRAGSSLVSLVPHRSELLVSPHFVAPPTSPLCAPLSVLVPRSFAPLSLLRFVSAARCPLYTPASSPVSFPSLTHSLPPLLAPQTTD